MKDSLFDNRFHIVELLGVGTTAKVYRAVDGHTSTEVALKVFDESRLGNEEELKLFEREIRVVARLDKHPNLLNYYGGSLKEGRRYLVMEIAQGETLMHYLNRYGGRLPLDVTLSVFSQLLSALSFVHKRGIIHRDVKPQNIRIASDGTIKLCDFGIAVIQDSEQKTIGKAIGTVNYISPEQARGIEVYPCSDLYSAGVVLYEMLTGHLPFTSDKPSAQDRMNEIIRKHFKEVPIRPTHYNPNIPDAVEQIVLKALSKNPSSRFESADEILRYLALYYRNPSVHFDFELPNDEFDYKAALPHNTSAGAFKPQPTVKELSKKIEKKDREKRLTRKTLLVLSLFLTLSLITAVVIYVTLHSLLFYKLDERTVITKGDLLHRQYSDEIYQALIEEGYDVTVEYTFSSYYPSGTIVSQTPLPLTVQEINAKEAPKLTLTVSIDDATVLLSRYQGVDYRLVQIELAELGIDTIVNKSPSAMPAGQVISTSPSANEVVHLSGTVTLNVSTGAKIVYAYMPNLIGSSLAQAKSQLSDRGISYEIIFTDSDAPYGTVVYQSRAYGEKLPLEYTTVYLKVSNRIKTPDSTEPLEIPNEQPHN